MAAILANVNKPLHARYAKNPAAGLWRRVPPSRWPGVTKTKAHRTEQQAKDSGDHQDWQGNDLADSEAKAAALAGDPPDVIERISAFRHKALGLLKAMVSMVSRATPLTPPTRQPPGGPAMREERPNTEGQQHDYLQLEDPDTMVCAKCFKLKHCKEFDATHCSPPPQQGSASIPCRNGHPTRAPCQGGHHHPALL